ncbi:MAG: hypothetical protein KDD02_10205 [Phaeodactylibacter sp.]|nr:hypothetical protein [Phaeodactylibacter sp.]MCB9299440.1 hypothetical protein [Lewinellaceae bacterium]HQU60205.1 hypothetical protein [Saprospiraceae bacterium]
MHRGTGFYALIDRFIELDFETERMGVLPKSGKALFPENALTLSEIVKRGKSFIVYNVFVNPRNACHFLRVRKQVCPTRGIAEAVVLNWGADKPVKEQPARVERAGNTRFNPN